MNSKKLFAYSLVFCVLLSILVENVNSARHHPKTITVHVNGTIDDKDIGKVVKKVVKEGGKLAKKVNKEGGKAIKKEAEKFVKKNGGKIAKKVAKEGGKIIIKAIGKKFGKILG